MRVCHWVNAICFVVLLMSGMQIFNADPALTWGQTTNFDKPFFSLSAREDDNGDPTAGVTTIFGHAFDTTGLLRRLARRRRRLGGARLSLLGDAARLAGSGDGPALALLLRLDPGAQRARLFREPHPRPPHPRPLAEPRGLAGAPARDRRPRAAPVSLRARRRCITTCCRSSPISASSSPFRSSILAGLTMSPAVDAAFPWLLTLFHGRQAARAVHFLLATYLVLFVIVHLVMVVLSGPINNMRSMITGRYRIKEAAMSGELSSARRARASPAASSSLASGSAPPPRRSRAASLDSRSPAALMSILDKAEALTQAVQRALLAPQTALAPEYPARRDLLLFQAERLDRSRRSRLCRAAPRRLQGLEARGRRPRRTADEAFARRLARAALALADHPPRLRRGLELHRPMEGRPTVGAPRRGGPQAAGALHRLLLRRHARADARQHRPLLRDDRPHRRLSSRRPSSPTR